MYKALIIDDEKPVRQVIRALGSWKEMGIEHIFEATEGESGLEIMRKNRPEIVFVDMKMPNMNGVDFLKAARNEFPDAKYIVISGYEDFEYTREAIKCKVLDYLLKPVVEEELNNVIRKAVKELNEEKNKRIENIKASILQNISLPIVKEKLITLILEGQDTTFLEKEQRDKILGISDTFTHYGVVLFSCVNLDEVACKFENDLFTTFYSFTNVINELSSEWCNGFSFRKSDSYNEIVLLIMASFGKDADVTSIVCDKVNYILKKLEELFGAYCIAVIGGFVRKFSEIRDSYKAAQDIMDNINILDSTERVFCKSVCERKASKVSLLNSRELLVYAFENGSMEYARSIINKYFDELSSERYLSRDDLYKIAMEFVIIIENIVKTLGISGIDELLPANAYKNTIMSFTKLDDYKNFVYEVVEKVMDCVKANLEANKKSYLYAIKDFIDKNYFMDIKLSDFSNKYYISKEYLSKQFKTEFNYGIYEYVLKIRMEKAKEMLSDPSAKIQAVAEHIGYKDSNYFSRAFKNYFGVSPTEYRDNMSN